MPAAARVDDPITHSEAQSEGVAEMLKAAAWGALVGVALIGLTVITGGSDLLIIGAAVAAGGTVLSAGGKGFLQGVKQGQQHVEKHGQVKTGSASVTINGRRAAAACLSLIDCDEHSGPQKMAQGSRTVTINGKMASRVGDRSTCDGVIGAGSGNVTIGGAMGQCAAISKEVADWETTLAHGAIILGSIAQFVGMILTGAGVVSAIRAAPVFLRAVLAARAGVGFLGSMGFGAAGSHYGGKWFGEGSWQQEGLGTVSALVGGGLIGKVSERFGGMQPGEPATSEDVAQLKEATQPHVDEEALKSNSTRSPCVTGVKDLRTGETFVGRNTMDPIENLHPALQSRAADYVARNDGGAFPNDGGRGYPAKVTPEFEDGGHSEINALNDAFNAREAAGLGPVTETQMNEFLIQNVNMSRNPNLAGQAMPRCRTCFEVTYGAQVTPEVGAAESDYYSGTGFMKGVSDTYQGPQGQNSFLPGPFLPITPQEPPDQN